MARTALTHASGKKPLLFVTGGSDTRSTKASSRELVNFAALFILVLISYPFLVKESTSKILSALLVKYPIPPPIRISGLNFIRSNAVLSSFTLVGWWEKKAAMEGLV